MTTFVANDFETIRRKLEEIEAQQNLALTGSTLPQPEAAKETKTESHMYGSYGDYAGWQLKTEKVPEYKWHEISFKIPVK